MLIQIQLQNVLDRQPQHKHRRNEDGEHCRAADARLAVGLPFERLLNSASIQEVGWNGRAAAAVPDCAAGGAANVDLGHGGTSLPGHQIGYPVPGILLGRQSSKVILKESDHPLGGRAPVTEFPDDVLSRTQVVNFAGKVLHQEADLAEGQVVQVALVGKLVKEDEESLCQGELRPPIRAALWRPHEVSRSGDVPLQFVDLVLDLEENGLGDLVAPRGSGQEHQDVRDEVHGITTHVAAVNAIQQ